VIAPNVPQACTISGFGLLHGDQAKWVLASQNHSAQKVNQTPSVHVNQSTLTQMANETSNLTTTGLNMFYFDGFSDNCSLSSDQMKDRSITCMHDGSGKDDIRVALYYKFVCSSEFEVVPGATYLIRQQNKIYNFDELVPATLAERSRSSPLGETRLRIYSNYKAANPPTVLFGSVNMHASWSPPELTFLTPALETGLSQVAVQVLYPPSDNVSLTFTYARPVVYILYPQQLPWVVGKTNAVLRIIGRNFGGDYVLDQTRGCELKVADAWSRSWSACEYQSHNGELELVQKRVGDIKHWGQFSDGKAKPNCTDFEGHPKTQQSRPCDACSPGYYQHYDREKLFEASCKACPAEYYQHQNHQHSCILCASGHFTNGLTGSAICETHKPTKAPTQLPTQAPTQAPTPPTMSPTSTTDYNANTHQIVPNTRQSNTTSGRAGRRRLVMAVAAIRESNVTEADSLQRSVWVGGLKCAIQKWMDNEIFCVVQQHKGTDLLVKVEFVHQRSTEDVHYVGFVPKSCQQGWGLDTERYYCIPCPPGKYSDSNLPSDCEECIKGKYEEKNTSKTACFHCSTGSYQDGKGQSVCKACAEGQFQDIAGSSSCHYW
jgi:hypothetical protein